MKTEKYIAVISLGMLILAGITSYLLYLWTDYNKFVNLPNINTSEIVKAANRFYNDKNEIPKSLNDLVNKGYLPQSAKFYRSYLRKKSDKVSSLSYKNIEYDVSFDIEEKGYVVFTFNRDDLNKYLLPNKKFESDYRYRKKFALVK